MRSKKDDKKVRDADKKPAADDKRRPATGLIGGGASGVGEMTDPRLIAPR